MSLSESSQYYVPQLDGLRFFAFFLVFMHHFNFSVSEFSFLSILVKVIDYVKSHGWIGVDLFLVLSSFLITNLLIKEFRQENKISLKDFYIRRTLRIWPLYYFIIIVGFFINPILRETFGTLKHQAMIDNHLISYFIFLGNFSAGIHDYADSYFLAHLWTISLEEQFYIIWPIILFFFLQSKKHLYMALCSLLCMTFILRYYYVINGPDHPWIWTSFFTRLDPLILGSLIALYREDHPSDGKWNGLEYFFGLLFIVLPTFFTQISEQSPHVVWQYFSIAAGFGLILDASIVGKVKWLNDVFTNPVLVWMGKLCYGLYVYHLLGSNIGIKLTKLLHLDDFDIFSWALAFLLSLLITILLSWLSYRYLEKYFLKLKYRFTHVPSRQEGGGST